MTLKKILILLVVVFVLFMAYVSKPDDKTCMEVAVKAVWGNLTPEKLEFPEYYEQFMDLNHTNVVIYDCLFFKHVKYKVADDEKSIAIAAFKRFFYT
jgi:hypothetical protein